MEDGGWSDGVLAAILHPRSSVLASQQPLLPGDLQDLLECLLHLPRRLRVDAIAAARLHAEIALLGELVGAHQRVEVRLLAGLEQFARFLDMLVVAAKAHQQIAPAHQRGAQRRRRHAAISARLHQHARIARVHRQRSICRPMGVRSAPALAIGVYGWRVRSRPGLVNRNS